LIIVFTISVSVAIGVSFFCSLAEASLFAVPLPHVKHLAESGSRSGRLLLQFKEDMGQPIAAILILNTLSNTAGAAVAGASATALWGAFGLLIFSVIFTVVIMVVSEICPKVLGVTYSKQISGPLAVPISLLIVLLRPFVALSQAISRRLNANVDTPRVSEEEVLAMAALGTEEGTLDKFEGSVISNVMNLNDTLIRDVLTPRVSVFKLREKTTIGAVQNEIFFWNYTRVPLFNEKDPDHLTSYVIQRDIFRACLRGEDKKTLKELARPLHVLPELTTADKVLAHMFEHKEHICSLVDEHGALAGIVTQEDIFEEIIGHEIEDEYDVTD